MMRLTLLLFAALHQLLWSQYVVLGQQNDSNNTEVVNVFSNSSAAALNQTSTPTLTSAPSAATQNNNNSTLSPTPGPSSAVSSSSPSSRSLDVIDSDGFADANSTDLSRDVVSGDNIDSRVNSTVANDNVDTDIEALVNFPNITADGIVNSTAAPDDDTTDVDTPILFGSDGLSDRNNSTFPSLPSVFDDPSDVRNSTGTVPSAVTDDSSSFGDIQILGSLDAPPFGGSSSSNSSDGALGDGLFGFDDLPILGSTDAAASSNVSDTSFANSTGDAFDAVDAPFDAVDNPFFDSVDTPSNSTMAPTTNATSSDTPDFPFFTTDAPKNSTVAPASNSSDDTVDFGAIPLFGSADGNNTVDPATNSSDDMLDLLDIPFFSTTDDNSTAVAPATNTSDDKAGSTDDNNSTSTGDDAVDLGDIPAADANSTVAQIGNSTLDLGDGVDTANEITSSTEVQSSSPSSNNSSLAPTVTPATFGITIGGGTTEEPSAAPTLSRNASAAQTLQPSDASDFSASPTIQPSVGTSNTTAIDVTDNTSTEALNSTQLPATDTSDGTMAPTAANTPVNSMAPTTSPNTTTIANIDAVNATNSVDDSTLAPTMNATLTPTNSPSVATTVPSLMATSNTTEMSHNATTIMPIIDSINSNATLVPLLNNTQSPADSTKNSTLAPTVVSATNRSFAPTTSPNTATTAPSALATNVTVESTPNSTLPTITVSNATSAPTIEDQNCARPTLSPTGAPDDPLSNTTSAPSSSHMPTQAPRTDGNSSAAVDNTATERPTQAPITNASQNPTAAPSLLVNSTQSPSSAIPLSVNGTMRPTEGPSQAVTTTCQIDVSTSNSVPSAFVEFPIAIDSSDGETVTFHVSQRWIRSGTIDMIATAFYDSETIQRCDKAQRVPYDTTLSYTAYCEKNVATVSLFAFDRSFNATDGSIVPAHCGTMADSMENKIEYSISLPCDCSPSPATVTQNSTQSCTYYEIGFDDKDLNPGTYVSNEWEKDYGLFLSAENGRPRLFNTAETVNISAGTSGLSGSFEYGDVLIVQPIGDGAPKANENGGRLVFEFREPIAELIEVGLLNVVAKVEVQVTTVDGAVTTFVVPPNGLGSSKTMPLVIPQVSRIDVLLDGPSAVTLIGFCHDFDFTPSPSITPSQKPLTNSSSTETNLTQVNTAAPSKFLRGNPTRSPITTLAPNPFPSAYPTSAPTPPTTFNAFFSQIIATIISQQKAALATRTPTPAPSPAPTYAPISVPWSPPKFDLWSFLFPPRPRPKPSHNCPVSAECDVSGVPGVYYHTKFIGICLQKCDVSINRLQRAGWKCGVCP